MNNFRVGISLLLLLFINSAFAEVPQTPSECAKVMIMSALTMSSYSDLSVSDVQSGYGSYLPVVGDSLDYGFKAEDKKGNQFYGYILLGEMTEVYNDRSGEFEGYSCPARYTTGDKFELINSKSGALVFNR